MGKRIPTLILIAVAGTLFSGTPEPWKNLDDFENGRKSWSMWADSSSKPPEFSLVAAAQGGGHVASILFPATSGQAIAGKHGIFIPRNENALRFRICSSVGAMPELLLEEAPGAEGAGDVFRYRIPAAAAGQWVEMTVPLSDFAYAYTKGGKGNRMLDRNAMFSLNISFSRQPGAVTLLLDDLAWTNRKEAK